VIKAKERGMADYRDRRRVLHHGTSIGDLDEALQHACEEGVENYWSMSGASLVKTPSCSFRSRETSVSRSTVTRRPAA